ncbi:helix-turn-helix domain-containing protein [Nonomuraea sp. 3-1Str]|uniref:helix-turn-helix domain-containing protein n=1 Tax=Nonomuraea sp. 3-1Str TaxID=2929801 RepID=UPI00285B426F|nr:helix-turn-helix transcriptional regulator [Nonomuraea sp. 3-1Str]MDR8412310.1 helix-turn-helix domain-containing protein [Nonomuraea sp. 3-1Str]
MSAEFVKWGEVKAKARELDPRGDVEREAGLNAARGRLEAYELGHRLSEMRRSMGVTQAEVAEALGVSQGRISRIESGEVSGIEVVRAYVTALGGTVDIVATLGGRTWKVA